MTDDKSKINLNGNLLDILEQADTLGLDDTAKQKLYGEYFSLRTRQEAIPYHGSFELTPLCNLNCKMCYVHLTQQQMENHALLTKDEWIQLIDQAAAAGMMKAALTGGECLTYPAFDEIFLHLQSLGIQVAVLTNGLLLDDERIQFFCDHPPGMIQITLYGSSNDEYGQVCGVRCFNRVLTNIQHAKDAGLPLYIAITPNRFLSDGGEALLRLVNSLGIPYDINSCLFSPRSGTGRENDTIDMDIEDYIKLYSIRAQLNGNRITPVDSAGLPPPANRSERQVAGLLCGAGMNTFTVQWDGKMVPCSSLSQYGAYPLKSGFGTSWDYVHHIAVNYPIPSECGECAYNCVCPACVAVHAQDAEPGHASRRQCNRAIRLIESGLAHLN